MHSAVGILALQGAEDVKPVGYWDGAWPERMVIFLRRRLAI
jgi:hypothetical protein